MSWAFLSNRYSTPPLTLGAASKVLALVMLSALATKFAVEGAATLPPLCRRRAKRTLAFFFLGFFFFPIPEVYPQLYWLFHSLWHVFLAAAYYSLYGGLLEAEGPGSARKPPVAAAKGRCAVVIRATTVTTRSQTKAKAL